MDMSFYKGKTVLITGHTGFKEAGRANCFLWQEQKLSVILSVTSTTPSLFRAFRS